MQPASLIALALAAAAAAAACGEAGEQPVVDAAVDGVGGACAVLDEATCLARSDCHAGYELFPCRNILGYCAEYRGCEAGVADCLGPASCERVEPFCAGPYVNSYRGLCYGLCVRADQCAGCRADKMRFTQAAGCDNDGSVEFCIPPVLEHAIAAIAPTATCAPGGGRARCDRESQLLCSFPTGAAECATPHGALTDPAWDTLCGITMLPDVVEIVHTVID